MRLRTNIIFILLSFFTVASQSNARETYEPLPTYLDGSMMPYDFSKCDGMPSLPDTLQPVYAAYIARHGARYLSSFHKMKPVVDALESASASGSLSSTGKAFMQLLDTIRSANEGNWGDLSPEGYREERLLGLRLYNIMTPMHSGTRRVNSVSSYISRCVMTMYLTMNAMVRENDSLSVMTDEGHQFDKLVCCFMADPEFAQYRKDGYWKKAYDEYMARNVSPEPARRLFKHTDLNDHQLRKLTFDIYEVLKANRAAGLPAPTTQWMSVEEYEGCWRTSNLQHYLRNTLNVYSDIAARATSPLLRSIISDVDKAASGNVPEPVVNGYFGHAETLLPLLSLMQVPGCYEMTSDFSKLEKTWRIEDITPLGANLLILISRGPSGHNYLSMQLNGRNVTPMPGGPDIVPWENVKAFWTSLLDRY